MLCLLMRSDLAFCVVHLVSYSEASMLMDMWTLYSGVNRKCGDVFPLEDAAGSVPGLLRG
jgi:hypothetical protein